MSRPLRVVALAAAVFAIRPLIGPAIARAQEADPVPTTRDSAEKYTTTIAGEFTPGQGFDVINTKRGSLNISMYGVFRYVNQAPQGQTFRDHLGRLRDVNPRNDINWHRTFVWLTGFFHDQKFRYNVSLWSLPTTQQTLLFGNLQYRPYSWLGVGLGVAPNLTARSLQGSWPYWAGSDRQMAEEFFRGGFSSGFWLMGNVTPKLTYTLSINNNISQLGTIQANDTRDMMYSGSVRWQPTTGEFGPRNGFGDFEFHQKLATQFGASGATGRESRYAQASQAPNATQIKLSDGVNPFEEGALIPFVTVNSLHFDEGAIDAGAKYRGFSFQSEYYFRTLSHFVSTNAVKLPLEAIFDHGFMAEAGYMVIQKRLGLHVVSGYVWDDFERHPWEAGGGANIYPTGSRAVRLNVHLLHVDKSPVNSFFSYYLAGQTGTIFSIGVDFLF